MAEEVGFEPTVPCGTTVFKTAAFNHSAIPPQIELGQDITNDEQDAHLMEPHLPPDDAAMMRLALEEALRAGDAGEVPIGAVVVHQPYDRATRRFTGKPQVIARAHNQREMLKDPSAHAEFTAMLMASKELDRWRLTDCTVYVTLEPCIMCAGLMQQSRISRCVFGAHDPKGGALSSLYNVADDARLNHSFSVAAGALKKECANVLKDFFKRRRG